MPLFVSQVAQTFPDLIEIALLNIAGPAVGGLGDGPVPGDLTVRQITFQTIGGGAAEFLLDRIINQTPNNPIVLLGVDDTFILPNGVPITNQFGWTTWPSLSVASLPVPGEIIRIFLDVSECSEIRYCACAAGGNPTSMPAFVMLFHELSHALHAADGTLDFINPEVQAIADENALRAQRGVLPLRDPFLYGDPNCTGCGRCTPATPPPPPPDCFVASVAYGSPLATKVQMFRRLRDAFLRRSVIGNAFFANFYAEYDGFSRLVVADLRASQELKTMVTRLVADPLYSFLTLFHLYMRGGWKRKDFGIEVDSLLRSDLAELAVTGLDLKLVEATITQLIEYFSSHGASDGARHKLVASSEAYSDPLGVLTYLANKVVSSTPSTAYLTWAVFRPLGMYWSSLVEMIAGRMRGREFGPFWGNWLEEWLAAFPIPSEFGGLSEEVVRSDLAILAETVFTIPAVRQRVGERLLNWYGEVVPYDLRSLLRSMDYGGGELEGQS